jgi:hypothetical protein
MDKGNRDVVSKPTREVERQRGREREVVGVRWLFDDELTCLHSPDGTVGSTVGFAFLGISQE